MEGVRAASKFSWLSLSILSKSKKPPTTPLCGGIVLGSSSRCCTKARIISSSIASNASSKKKKNSKSSEKRTATATATATELLVKRRTRSNKELDDEMIEQYLDVESSHIPVMLAQVLEVFSSTSVRSLRSFVDCTVGAAGHSSAIIKSHPELQYYIGMDVDPTAHRIAQDRINALLQRDFCCKLSESGAKVILKNFRFITSVLNEEIMDSGVDGILMDLGMSSMQVNSPERGFSVLNDGPLDMRMDPHASLKAEDILNSWPDAEIGRILRDYGEESSWFSLQNKIVKHRNQGGLHSTGELVELIRSSTPKARGGRQGWIKTATRVFQALRIAVNDELKTLEESLYACFSCLAPGGRLAVISFHSLEDRMVKQTFLKIIKDGNGGDGDENESFHERNLGKIPTDVDEEAWIKQTVKGVNGIILTKRPITPSQKEEELNRRSRSAKLRVIQKI